MSSSSESSTSLCKKGDSYLSENDYAHAYLSYETALRLTSSTPKSLTNARPLKGIGTIHYALHHDEEALECLTKAKRLYKKNGMKDSKDIAEVYELLGDVYLKKKKYALSSKKYRKSMHIIRKHANNSGGNEKRMSEIAHKRGTVHIRRGNKGKARKRFAQAKTLHPHDDDTHEETTTTKQSKSQFLNTNQTLLKNAINSPNNDAFNSFCDLELFSKFSLYIEHLKNTLQSTIDLTADKCTVLRSVCRQHLDLQILLLEGQSGMKARLHYDATYPTKKGQQVLIVEPKEVDDFLHPFVTELSSFTSFLKEEVLVNRLGSFATLAMEQDTGVLTMKAVVKMVEEYEAAIDYYKDFMDGGDHDTTKNDDNDTEKIKIEGIQDVVLRQCRKDFEIKSFEIMTDSHMSAADDADEENLLSSQLTATIQGATKLLTFISSIHSLFSSSTTFQNLDLHWALSVCNVCHNYILQKVGFTSFDKKEEEEEEEEEEESKLKELDTKQLLDLSTWIESFCDTMENTYPSISSSSSHKPATIDDDKTSFFEEKAELLNGTGAHIEEKDCLEGIAWTKGMLWEVHHLAQELYEERSESERFGEGAHLPVVSPVGGAAVGRITKDEEEEEEGEQELEEGEEEMDDLYKMEEVEDHSDSESDDDEEEDESSTTTGQSEFLTSNLKKLRSTINSSSSPSQTKDIFTSFCNLKLFSNIPPMVESIRISLESTQDLKKDKCSLLRSACRDHLDLQILLVEADSGMKERLKKGEEKKGVSSKSGGGGGTEEENEEEEEEKVPNANDVDEFLSPYIKDVWDLGEFIQETLSNIGSFANLAVQNPPAMKALIDIVEEYEVAVDYYKETAAAAAGEDEGGEKEGKELQITSIKETVITQCRRDFEIKSFEVFSIIHMLAADDAEEDDAVGSQLTATVHAATKLVGEIEPVKKCFPRDWGVDVHWALCVSNVCSNHLLQQIGGPEGQNLPQLSTTQLLDLITWIEFFCETFENAYPSITKMKPEKVSFESRPDLLNGDGKKVDNKEAMNGLAWARNMLWEVHRLSKDLYEERSSQSDKSDKSEEPVPAAAVSPVVEEEQSREDAIRFEAPIGMPVVTLVDTETKSEKEESDEEVKEVEDVKVVHWDNQEMSEERESRKGSQSRFLATSLKELRSAINAPNNAFNQFCELELFSDIRSILDRLKNTLQTEDLTRDKCSIVRSACKEHLDLETLLVEADTGMKERLQKDKNQKVNKGKEKSPTKNEDVDEFLAPFIRDVWEFGEFIELTLLSRIGSFANLTLENPPAMKALIDVVEEYEVAIHYYQDLNDQKEASADGNDQALQITSIKEEVKGQCRRDFELRSFDVFSKIHMYAADNADEDDAFGSQLTASIEAATNLVGEIDPVKKCFPSDWGIDVHWSLCVSNVCSNYLVQKIGGPDGHNLPDLSLTQLLDLITWVEFFCNTFEDAFPCIAEKKPGKMSADSRPELLNGDGREIKAEEAMDGLAWAKNMLWEVHRLAKEEFLVKTRTQTDTWLDNIYGGAERTRSETTDGKLITSLCEEIFSFVNVHLRTIRDHLPPKSEIFAVAVCIVLSRMQAKQLDHRDKTFNDLETCCAAANDFNRMSERIEEMMTGIKEESGFSESDESMLDEACLELVSLYSSHAVYAAQRVHVYVFEPINESIAEELFGLEWEDNLTHNQLSNMVVKTIEDFRCDLEIYLPDFLLKKVLDALVVASVIFYIQSLLMKSEKHNLKTVSCFNDVTKALGRMQDDIQVMRKYFEGHVETMPALRRTIQREFEVLTIVRECLSVASTGESVDEATNFVYVLHKRFSDVEMTKQFIGDLWHLVAPTKEREVRLLVESMETELKELSPPGSAMQGQSQVPGLRLDEMVRKLYSQSKRRRPGKLYVSMNHRRHFSADASDLAARGSTSPTRRSIFRNSLVRKPGADVKS